MVNNKESHEVERPLVHFVICYILGIIGGNILLNLQNISLFFYILILCIILVMYGFYYDFRRMMQCIGCILIGIIFFLNLPLHQEQEYFRPNVSYHLKGQIEEVKTTPYYNWITLKSVEDIKEQRCLKCKVQVRMPLSYEISTYDYIEAKVTCMKIEPQMNPSDIDYELYLKGQQVAAVFKVQNLIQYEERMPWIESIQKCIVSQLEKLFSKEKIGIMEAVILGNDRRLNSSIEELYQKAGISHVLCISGFHVGVVIGGMMALYKLIPISYSLRQILLMITIIAYTLLTGYGTSTVRAAIMICVTLLGKCLWQEDDGLTNVAIAGLIILIVNPYQLFRVGFQLSFMAVIAVILCSNEIEKKELTVEWRYPHWQRTILIWMSVQLLTWSIIAYHFYEIPFIASLFNLVVIPIFSMIIVVGWWLVILSFLPIPIAYIGSWLIESILDGITWGLKWVIKLPLSSLCTGRPNYIEYIIYFCAIAFIWAIVWGYCKKIYLYRGLFIIGCCYSIGIFMGPKHLRITSLYVGQGDCSIIEMPKYGVFVVDGGNFGQGHVVENYVKYLGYDEIQGIMVSHSDLDHMGGILELLESSLEVQQVFISEAESSQELQTLKSKCQKNKIPIYALGHGKQFQYGNIVVECLAPTQNHVQMSNNDNSIVCKLKYGKFSVLFTGDQSKELAEKLCEEDGTVTLLKVSHHGSRTGTSKELLLKLQPKYAMISCGRNNRYGHPHQEVVTLLEEAKIEVSRTDIEGAICYETDGKYIKKTSYRKDA